MSRKRQAEKIILTVQIYIKVIDKANAVPQTYTRSRQDWRARLSVVIDWKKYEGLYE